jgi:hypothetical protein
VERTFSWLGKCRRLAVDYEPKPEHHQAWVQRAMVRVMVKRLARQAPHSPPERSAWPHDVIRTGSQRRGRSTVEVPGRSCPLTYRYQPEALAQPAQLEADTLCVVGGLYGNPAATSPHGRNTIGA